MTPPVNAKAKTISIERVRVAIERIKQGEMVIMVDDEKRENEGDLIFAAQDACPQKINFMAKEARGLICLPMSSGMLEHLQLPMMGDHNKRGTPMGTAFTVSIEAAEGVTTGISAADRAHTIAVAVKKGVQPSDVVVPGHIFPLKAKKGGVLERTGHTEGSVDLSRLAGKSEAAVCCEIMKDDGTMARLPDLEVFAKQHGIPIVSIEDLVTYRLHNEVQLKETKSRQIKNGEDTYTGVWFNHTIDGQNHFALLKGIDSNKSFPQNSTVDVRVMKQSLVDDVFGDRRGIVDYGLQMLKNSKFGAVIYLANEETGSETSNDRIDPRLFGTGAQILRNVGVEKMRLHVGSKRSMVGIAGFGLEIVDTVIMSEK